MYSAKKKSTSAMMLIFRFAQLSGIIEWFAARRRISLNTLVTQSTRISCKQYDVSRFSYCLRLFWWVCYNIIGRKPMSRLESHFDPFCNLFFVADKLILLHTICILLRSISSSESSFIFYKPTSSPRCMCTIFFHMIIAVCRYYLRFFFPDWCLNLTAVTNFP